LQEPAPTGVFTFNPVPAGNYTLIVRKCGFKTTGLRGVTVAPGKTTYFENPPIVLSPVYTDNKKNKHRKQ
jgi:hypothetical protein